MTFEYTIFFYVAAAAFALSLFASARIQSAKRKLLVRFVSEEMLSPLTSSISRFKIHLKALMFASAVALLFVAMARPQYGHTLEEEKTFGLDIIFAVDTSKSMLAEDLKPNRLELSKLAINDLVDRLAGDRVGLVAFSGEAFLQCPITLDYDAFRLSLEALDTNIIQRGGTNIAAAISEAESAFAKTKNKKLLILISDGEELEAAALPRAEKAFKESEIKIYTLGAGGAKSEPIPVRDSKGRLDYLRDEKGNLVESRLNKELLSKIAESTGGFFATLADGGIEMIFEDGVRQSERSETSARTKKRAIERYQIPLAVAILLLVIDSITGTRKLFARRSGRNLAALFIAFAFILPCKSEAKDKPLSWREYFNKSVDAYETKDFKTAKENLYQSLGTTFDLLEHAKTFYNLGVIDYETAKSSADMPTFLDAQQKFRAAEGNAFHRLSSGAETLNLGLRTLEHSGEEGLKKQEIQNQIKQAISGAEESKKNLEESDKENKNHISALNKLSDITASARKNFENAFELDGEMQIARESAEVADKANTKIIPFIQNFKNFEISSKEQKDKLTTLIEDLKKLLRDENNQDQNKQDQDNQKQDKQDQDKKDQKQDNQQNDQQNKNEDKNNSEEDKSENGQNDSSENNDTSKESEQNKENGDKDKKPNDADNSDDSKQNEQAVAPEEHQSNDDSQQQQNGDKDFSENSDNTKDENAMAPEPAKEAAEENGPSLEQGATESPEDNQDFRAAAGAMTKREAGQVLNSLKDSEKKLPFSGYGTQKNRYEDKNYKDW